MVRSPLLVVMCAGYFLVLLDVTAINVALPDIGGPLAAGPAGLQRIVDGYAIALAGLLLAGGTVGDVHGHRRVVLTGLGVFGAASLACGLAQGIDQLVAARFVQGAGAALPLPGTLAIITDAFPAARARAVGVWAGVGSAALPAGPLLGGLLVEWVGWRSVFAVNVPVVLLAAVLTARFAPRDTRAAGRRVDWAGALAGTALLTTVIVAVIAGLPWLFAAAAVLLAVFVVVERTAADPMLPLTGLRADSSYWALLPALLLWGLGLAALTPAAVTSAGARSGLASGVDNTARQAGGAVGIAAFGAIAGSASNARVFVSGLHLSGLVAAVLFLVAGLPTVLMRSN